MLVGCWDTVLSRHVPGDQCFTRFRAVSVTRGSSCRAWYSISLHTPSKLVWNSADENLVYSPTRRNTAPTNYGAGRKADSRAGALQSGAAALSGLHLSMALSVTTGRPCPRKSTAQSTAESHPTWCVCGDGGGEEGGGGILRHCLHEIPG